MWLPVWPTLWFVVVSGVSDMSVWLLVWPTLWFVVSGVSDICWRGYWFVVVSGVGDICPRGYRCPAGSELPEGCPAGYYQDQEGQDVCIICPAGESGCCLVVSGCWTQLLGVGPGSLWKSLCAEALHVGRHVQMYVHMHAHRYTYMHAPQTPTPSPHMHTHKHTHAHT